MLLDRLRRRRSVPGALSCYGKLPFDREFLRFGLDFQAGRWVVDWVDGAHHVIAQAGEKAPAQGEIRAIIRLGKTGEEVIAALIRPSFDAGGRLYPVCVFTCCDASAFGDEWHLLPLWLESLWAAIDRQVLGASIGDRESLAGILDSAQHSFESTDGPAERFSRATATEIGQPWFALTGAGGERGAELAHTFIQLAEAQRAAADGEEVAVRIPLAPAPALAARCSGSTLTAAWMRLFAGLADRGQPWPGVIEVRERGQGTWQGVCLFAREPTAADLAYLLAGVGEPAIDEITTPWGAAPAGERAQRGEDSLLDAQGRCLADLWGARA